jgi:Ser-tRNA(Ala) deacylase AlaX
LERELEQARLDARARSVALEKERIDKREKIIQEARIQSEKYKLDKEQKDRILRIKQKQQEEKTRADRQAREERIRIETETLMREEQEQRANLQAIRELKDPDNLKRNLELAQIQENARLLALYIQTIEETKPGSSVLPGAYKQLEIWCKMKEELK